MNLYERLADDIGAAISKGLFKPGEKIPSVRMTSKRHGLSITTVLRGFRCNKAHLVKSPI